MTTISVSKFYKTRITTNGVQNAQTTVAAILPDPTVSDNEYCGSDDSADEADDLTNIIADDKNIQYESYSEDESSNEDDQPPVLYVKKTYNLRQTVTNITPESPELSDESDNNDADFTIEQQPSSSKTNFSLRILPRNRTRSKALVQNDSQSESESTGDEDEPLKKVTSANYRWRKRNPVLPNSTYTGHEFPDPPAADQSARDYFDQFLEPRLFVHNAEQSNLYSVQTTGKSVNTNAREIEQYMGILIQMGILKYPQ